MAITLHWDYVLELGVENFICAHNQFAMNWRLAENKAFPVTSLMESFDPE